MLTWGTYVFPFKGKNYFDAPVKAIKYPLISLTSILKKDVSKHQYIRYIKELTLTYVTIQTSRSHHISENKILGFSTC